MLVFFAGLAFASFPLAGGIVWSVTVMLSFFLCTGLAIVCFVGRRELRAFAIGFVIPVIAYACVLLAMGQNEMDPYNGRLLTSRALRPVFETVVTRKWVDLLTGKEVRNDDPRVATEKAVGGAGVGLSESLDRPSFMGFGHLLIALAFGYVGGKLAVAVYRRQRSGNSRAESAT
ncbi:MAG: hypothetical protein WD845_06535, partial [Pirellulales bacterium]